VQAGVDELRAIVRIDPALGERRLLPDPLKRFLHAT